jgi:hypothetical protein
MYYFIPAIMSAPGKHNLIETMFSSYRDYLKVYMSPLYVTALTANSMFGAPFSLRENNMLMIK